IGVGSVGARVGSGREDGPSPYLAGVEVVDGRLEAVEGVLHGVQMDRSAGGEHHELDQVVVRTDEVADEVDLIGDDVDRRNVDVLAVAHDVVVARTAEHLHTLAAGPPLTDEIDHCFRAVAPGELQNLFNLGAVGNDCVVGADGQRKLDGVRVAVDDDDLGGGQRLEDLNADVAQPPGADDHAAVPGRQAARGLGGGVVRGEARVGERRDIRGLQRVVDFHDAAGRGFQVLRVAAVGVDAGEGDGLAVHVVAGAAGTTQPAGDQRVDDDLVAITDVGHRGSDRVDPAGVLMPDGVGQLDLRLFGPLAFQDVQIGSAHARSADLHDDVERPGRGGDRYLRHLEVAVVADYLDGSHGAHRSCSFPSVGNGQRGQRY